ncbi:hypothetical protein P618_200522 [Holospora obtusa F1]|uniref:Uncharacterized protein n=1 Tax=Holospora obtusa F1 TaxID=1399147 RepID=W6TH73_HOLOB|nr:hypothetical protein P618_200522 [Holospora obtusa F1]
MAMITCIIVKTVELQHDIESILFKKIDKNPYSIDFRENVINFIKADNGQKETSIIFETDKMIINR